MLKIVATSLLAGPNDAMTFTKVGIGITSAYLKENSKASINA
jgi:hypothetical protein